MRAIGIIIVLISGVAGSFLVVSEFEKRLTNTRALCKLLRVCTEQVEYFSCSSHEILANCDALLLRECGYLDKEIPNDFSEFLDRCEILSNESRAIMIEFAKDFGKSYKDEQVKRCKYYLEKMDEHESKLESSLPAQRKLYFAILLAATLTAIILLI